MYISHSANISKKIAANFKDAVMLVGIEATKVISEPRAWEGFNDVRDIVDTGILRASQKIEFTSTGDRHEAVIRYLTEYASAVHNGATIRYPNGTVRRIRPRPWLEEAIKRVPIDVTLTRLK